jgi:hypothetical protein
MSAADPTPPAPDAPVSSAGAEPVRASEGPATADAIAAVPDRGLIIDGAAAAPRLPDASPDRSTRETASPAAAPPGDIGPPAAPAGAQTCEIGFREVGRTALGVDLEFEAVVRDAAGQTTIARSTRFSQPSYESEPAEYSSRARELLQQLVATLTEQGWTPVDEPAAAWYRRRFRRGA